ncbi:hypothetical protein TWF481_007054 [Arthrobotrys musiformis]|uniref:Secreted protein n=1 Tax=Arthrobotrys musiformis TaxID=47236 RepID=A0AAV9WAA5_9PEZI
MPILSTPVAFILAHLIPLLKLVELANASPIDTAPALENTTSTRWMPPPLPYIDPPEVPILNPVPSRGTQTFCAIV